MRIGRSFRKTKETEIDVSVNLDGTGIANVNTGVEFLNHMLRSLATHSLIDITVHAKGDLVHHIMEDTAICLGEAISEALGERVGIKRFGYALVPMDDALAYAAIDLAKRPYTHIDLGIEGERIEDASREDIDHFIRSLAMAMEANIHVKTIYGRDDHHKVEAAVKALALSLRQAVEVDERRKGVPSSKGVM